MPRESRFGAERPVGVDEAFAALTECLPNDASRIVLAVSGGPDSLALLVLAAENRQRFALRGQEFLVVVVDHGLRQEAADEAGAVARLADIHGFAHRIMRWQKGDGAGNLSARARDGRYALLCEASRAFGAGAVVTAHHQDDQIETHLIAAERGEDVTRLAAMRSRRDLAPGIVLCRPFLGFTKGRLKASLQERGISWAEDPSNLDRRYRRPRLRARLALISCEERAKSLRAIEEAESARADRDAAVCALLPFVAVDSAGVVGFGLDLLRGEPTAVNALLSRVLAAAGGAARRGSTAEIARLRTRLLESPRSAATLGGCFVKLEDQRVEIAREFGRSGPPALDCDLGDHFCFDERFDLAGPLPPSARRIVALGALGRGGAWRSTLPVVLDEAGNVIGGHHDARLRSHEARIPFDFRERVSWRLRRDTR